MPFERGSPGGPGRPKGHANKRTEALLEALKAAGMTDADEPAVFLYRVYIGVAKFKQDVDRKVVDEEGHADVITLTVVEPAPVPVRIQAAVACAKYVHPGLKAVELTGELDVALAPMFGEDFRNFVGAPSGGGSP